MQELNERVAKVEARLDSHSSRLDRHGDQIDSLRINDARIEAKLDSVCLEVQEVKKAVSETNAKVEENTEMTRGIKLGTKQIIWILSVAGSALGLYLTLTQLGWM